MPVRYVEIKIPDITAPDIVKCARFFCVRVCGGDRIRNLPLNLFRCPFQDVGEQQCLDRKSVV